MMQCKIHRKTKYKWTLKSREKKRHEKYDVSRMTSSLKKKKAEQKMTALQLEKTLWNLAYSKGEAIRE